MPALARRWEAPGRRRRRGGEGSAGAAEGAESVTPATARRDPPGAPGTAKGARGLERWRSALRSFSFSSFDRSRLSHTDFVLFFFRFAMVRTRRKGKAG